MRKEPQLDLLVSLTSRYVTSVTAFFFPLALVNIIRFSIQGMGYSSFAILAGVLEMAARAGVGLGLVPVFGYTAVCVASPAAWIAADLFPVPAAFACIRKLRKMYPNQPEPPLPAQAETAPSGRYGRLNGTGYNNRD